jgi:predicted dienelactone hydrolase
MKRQFITPILTAALALSVSTWADDNGRLSKDYAREIGKTPFKINTVPELVLHDAKRNKDLQLRINYPDAKGPFPVIVFSHGARASKDDYLPLTERWAGQGYVTIQPDHSDSRALGVKIGDTSVLRDWQNRPADVSFILDSLDELERKEPALKGKMNHARIGVGGHSFGANTAQLIGGAKAIVLGGEKSFADKRVTAVAILSGQGPGEMLTEESWMTFTRPMLVMTGSRDGPTRDGQPAVWRKKPYELSPPGDKYLVWVEDMDHGFGGIVGTAYVGRYTFKASEDQVKYTQIATLAFWDAYLKEDPEALAYLQSDKLARFSQKTATIEHK